MEEDLPMGKFIKLGILVACLLIALFMSLFFPQNRSIQEPKIWQSNLQQTPLPHYERPFGEMSNTTESLTPIPIPENLRQSQADPLKQVYLNWMQSVSRQDRVILEMIYDETSKYPLRDLLLAIIYRESWPKFNPWSYSKAQAMCLMQVNPRVWLPTLKKQGLVTRREELWRIDTCIRAGHFIITHYLNKYHGDLKKALTAYVGGDTRYADNVMRTLRQLAVLRMVAELQTAGLSISPPFLFHKQYSEQNSDYAE